VSPSDTNAHVEPAESWPDTNLHVQPSASRTATNVHVEPTGSSADTNVHLEPTGSGADTNVHVQPSASRTDTNVHVQPTASRSDANVQVERSIAEALVEYDRIRRPRVAMVVRRSRLAGRMSGALARTVLLVLPARVLVRGAEKMSAWEPPTREAGRC
jgi:hypothetical protein